MNLGKALSVDQTQSSFEEKPSKHLIKVRNKHGAAKLKILITSAVCVLAIAILVSAVIVSFTVGLRLRPSARKHLNEACEDTSECDTSRGLICTNGICSCLSDFEFREDSCVIKRIGRTCTEFSSCQFGYDLVCINSTCQ
jgi:hypothetical protein